MNLPAWYDEKRDCPDALHWWPKVLDLFDRFAPALGAWRLRTYLGIGVREASCVAALLTETPYRNQVETLVLCDTWGASAGGSGRGSHEHVAARLEALGYEGESVYLDGDSKREIPHYLIGHPETIFDFALVDGDHTSGGAEKDLLNVLPVSRVVLVHDYDYAVCRDVRGAVDRVHDRFGERVTLIRVPNSDARGAALLLNHALL